MSGMVRESYRGVWIRVLRNYPWFAGGLAGIVLAWLLVEWVVIFSPLSTSRVAWWVAHVGYFFLTAIPETALLRLADNIVAGRRPQRDLAPRLATIVRYTLLKFILGPVFLLGLGLLILPGLYIGARLAFVGFHVVVESQPVLAAIRKSLALSRSRVAPLMILVLSLLAMNLLGLALLGAGLLLTLPASCVVLAAAYRSTAGMYRTSDS